MASRYRDEVVYLEKIAPRTGVRVNVTRAGERLQAHCTAAGKVLLAHLSRVSSTTSTRPPPLRSLTDRSITDRSVLQTELDQVRGLGHALDSQESVEGMCCIAAPISNSHGDIAWALSMSFPEFRLASHGDAYAQVVVEAAQQLSEPAP